MVLKEIKETYNKIKKQYFASPCEKYMNEIVEELHNMGVPMEVGRTDDCSEAWGVLSPSIHLFVSHNRYGDHSDCGFWAKIVFRGDTEAEKALQKEVIREHWGALYAGAGNEKVDGVSGLKLMYPKDFRSSNTRFIYIEPHKLAKDLNHAIQVYENRKNP